ncbi:MAG: outer membrane beta-barrel protein, partial [Muribaculaceae bacterium]|nr:outer membrane beta-barrel protein [Muribaculaceae bacterium]
MRITRIILIAILIASGSIMSRAQSAPYRFDVGAGFGMTGYLGDANRSSLLKHPGFEGELSFRYIPNVRWAVRGVLSALSLSGSTADMDNILPSEGPETYDFKSTVYDLGGRVEFNFFNYGIGETYKRLRRWSPYLTLGVGVSLSSSGGNSSVAPNLPMGAGVKFKISERLNLSAEFTMTKVFGDKVDGPLLNDLNTIKTAFYKDTDWYSRLTIGISY